MPELPDLSAYLDSLGRLIAGKRLVGVKLFNPFLLRTAVPPIGAAEGKRVRELGRIGKRIVFALEDDVSSSLYRSARSDLKTTLKPPKVRAAIPSDLSLPFPVMGFASKS